ncbi:MULTISPECIES: amidohydrolase family protein [unclassified Acinetobacter]|uniref:metal-dependent hydrolase family protein n=1 Tax=unclassified Acinetobacter TaxID=196816 RepID=UPI002934CDEE|nr:MULTISPECIES: amidohydrolase family protein [unclassified Acinetobacter]WOE31796.1 amidohydrolase family protein [Acinetobacter sp. SAAs470]WOE37263.1 amidohydrolase family protein [Acinetobacter sp. SAAs474]
MPIFKLIRDCALLFFCAINAVDAHTPAQRDITATKSAINRPILFQNVQIFNGVSAKISPPMNVLIIDNKINKISSTAINIPANTQIINGQHKFLMPGLIDAHWHTMLAALPASKMLTIDLVDLNFIAAQEANNTLMRGFTSVRDLGGPVFALKRAIDSQMIDGPRIWPSGAIISQTGGHADFRLPHEIPSTNNMLSRGEVLGGGVIADGTAEVLKRTREQLMLGASQVKLAAGGGVSSHYDPIDVAQYTADEFKAAVNAAENWGTYVSVHAYTPKSIRTALNSGVKVIEHGQLIDNDTAKLMAQKGAWLSSQAFIDNEFANPQTGENREKQKYVQAGTDKSFELAKKYNIKVAWGTDILFNPQMTKNQGALLTTMTRWYTPAEVLKLATSTNAELLQLSGERSPYKGKLGVIEEGALADILLITANPIENINLLADPEKNLLIIMKNGVIYKNLID